MVKWTDERIIEEIRNHCKDTYSLRPRNVAKSYSSLFYATKERGGWRKWVEKAGLKYPWTVQKWTRAKLAQMLQEAHSMGVRCTMHDLRKHPLYRCIASSWSRHFDTLDELYAEAGIPRPAPAKRGPKDQWPEKRIIENLQQLSSIYRKEAVKENHDFVWAMQRRFGGWYDFLDHYNVPHPKVNNWSKEKILSQLREIDDPITIHPKSKLYGAIRKYFGSLETALQALEEDR